MRNKKDHTADYQSLLCGLSRLLAPLEDVTKKITVSNNPYVNAPNGRLFFIILFLLHQRI